MLQATVLGDKWKIFKGLMGGACVAAEARYILPPQIPKEVVCVLSYLLRDQRISRTITLSTDN